MDELAKLNKALADVSAKMQALFDKDEEGANDIAELEALQNEAKDLEAKIVTAEKKAKIMAENDARRTRLAQPATQPTSPVSDTAVTSGLRPRVLDDAQGGFARYDDFLGAVKSASRPGGVVDENLLHLNASYGNNADTGSEGGFLIPPEYSNRIIERMTTLLPIIGKCDLLTLNGNTVTVNGTSDHDKSSTSYRHGGIITYWVGEGDQITRSSLKFRQITLRLHKLAALSYCTEEEMTDVANFGSRLLGKQSEAIADELVEVVMFGSGVGQPMGAFVGTSPCVQVAKETGQAADTIVAENLVKMWSVISDGSRGIGDWYYNGECWPQLASMALAVGTGGTPVFLPVGGFSGAPNTSIFGRPAWSTDHCEALGDAGDITYADFSQYLLAMKGTTETAMSIHLRFDYAETAFRSLFRVDGRPAWDTNMKPRKGDSSRRVSPFVKLADR
jgi:HK97 family phage major capsid protein